MPRDSLRAMATDEPDAPALHPVTHHTGPGPAAMPDGWEPLAGHTDEEGPTAYIRNDRRAMVGTGGGYLRAWYVYTVTGWTAGGRATATRHEFKGGIPSWKTPTAAAENADRLIPRDEPQRAEPQPEPGGLRFWTIYKHPSDYPDHYVVRGSTVRAGAVEHDPACELFDTAAGARTFIARVAPHVVRMQSEGDDPDPCIFEVYV